MGKTANLERSANYGAGGFKVGLLGLEHAQLSEYLGVVHLVMGFLSLT